MDDKCNAENKKNRSQYTTVIPIAETVSCKREMQRQVFLRRSIDIWTSSKMFIQEMVTKPESQ